MKQLPQTIIKYTIWAIIFSGLSIASAYAPWNEPDPNCVAPDCNPDAPINTGTSAQNKSGALGATQFCDSNGANCLSTTQIISTSSASQTKLGSLTTTGFSSLSDAYFATDISVGTPSDPTSLGLVGLFNGKVGATEYCNENGQECNTPGENYSSNYILKRSSTYSGDSIMWCPATNPNLIYCQTIDDQASDLSPSTNMPPVIFACTSDGSCDTQYSADYPRNNLGDQDFYHEIVSKSVNGVIVNGCLNYDKGHTHASHKIDIICSK